ncbi:MAG: CPBP family intramembrane metalloprotease [Anaerolineae bacterium]|nr:CPBP family intramembrane metalloprotease [Anaerolineae bacterium]
MMEQNTHLAQRRTPSGNDVLFKDGKLWLYLVLAMGITALCWIPAEIIAVKYDYVLPGLVTTRPFTDYVDARHRVISILFSLGVYGPLVAAIVATALDTGTAGLKALLARVLCWRVAPKWYLTAFVIALLMPLLPFVIGTWMGAITSFSNMMTLPALLLFFLRQLVTSGLGEEPGWRGYLLPQLQARYAMADSADADIRADADSAAADSAAADSAAADSAAADSAAADSRGGERAIWYLGLIWAVWHYPITVYVALSTMGKVTLGAAIPVIVMSLAGQTLSLIGLTFIYTWLYNHTQSVFLMIVFHALTNTVNTIFAVGTTPTLTIITAAMPWVLVWVLEKVYGKAQFPGNPLP